MGVELPRHSYRKYGTLERCIYCGATEDLTDEHIVPFGLGGRWVLPKSSCKSCAALTCTFEGTCMRAHLGPLRLRYDMNSRRKRQRPESLLLKAKFHPDEDWQKVPVPTGIYPFLIGFPFLRLPDELTGHNGNGPMNGATDRLWIRGSPNLMEGHLEMVAKYLGATNLMPECDVRVSEFCLMIAKIAHSFAVAELGSSAFWPYLPEIIRAANTDRIAQYVGGLQKDEPPTSMLHEVGFASAGILRPELVTVRVRLLAALGTPTYFAVVGRRQNS